MLCAWVATDVGRVRNNQEDAFLSRPDLGMFAVSDGMGGHEHGEIASSIAISKLLDIGTEHKGALTFLFNLHEVKKNPAAHQQVVTLMKHSLEETINELNDSVLLAQCKMRSNMGCTISILWIVGPYAFVAHSGDSMIFRRRNRKLERLTVEHRNGHMLVGGLGIPGRLIKQVEVHSRQMFDEYLVCSDGVTTHLSDPEINQIMMNRSDQVPEQLVANCNARGGKDNITAIMVEDSLNMSMCASAMPVVRYGGPI